MTDAFAVMGIPRSLTLTDESLRDAFREAGKRCHPDAGGGEDEFSALKQAMEILSSPSRRLRHWLELQGIPVETRGTVDAHLMDLFAEVGSITQSAQSLIRKREETQSALALALLERQTHLCRESVEKAIARVESAISEECAPFPDWQSTHPPDPTFAAVSVRNLAFLEKWRANLRALFPRLI